MPSSNKTPFLQLNSWLGADKPKRQDFNTDNEKIDNAIKAHVEDTSLHGGGGGSSGGGGGGVITGSYVGTGEPRRNINLGQEVQAAVVFMHDGMPVIISSSAYHEMCFAMATKQGGSLGLAIDGTELVISHAVGMPPPVAGSSLPRLNTPGITYGYIAFT